MGATTMVVVVATVAIGTFSVGFLLFGSDTLRVMNGFGVSFRCSPACGPPKSCRRGEGIRFLAVSGFGDRFLDS